MVFHSLRHTSVTYKLKLSGGDIKAVQGDSGHAQADMVTEVYGHIIDEDRRKNAERMENAFYNKENFNLDIHEQKEEEIRMINEKLDFYVMEASDEEFDTEEVRKLVKRLDELDPIPLPWKLDEEALKDFWDYCEERQREERIIAEMKIKG